LGKFCNKRNVVDTKYCQGKVYGTRYIAEYVL
jgi:hypothetical protein